MPFGYDIKSVTVRVAQTQPHYTFVQINPVVGSWYAVMPLTDGPLLLEAVTFHCSAARDLEVRITIAGVQYTITRAAAATTTYYVVKNLDPTTTTLLRTITDYFLLDIYGREIMVEIRQTAGAGCTLWAKAAWGLLT